MSSTPSFMLSYALIMVNHPQKQFADFVIALPVRLHF
jgi:hypothetical protein